MESKSSGKVAIGTVQGDLHDIGKNLVSMMLEGAGFEVFDLGTDVKPETFIDSLRVNKADILAISALLTTTMTNMEVTIRALRESELRDQVNVLIGGAPVTTEFAEKIGADGYAADASQAVKVARKLISQSQFE
jgi:5-methyltetrahydrofolate--homocysteine methyltransferase